MDGFFFQAEDGIRDIGVTGVQTCALPIYEHVHKRLQTRSFNHNILSVNECYRYSLLSVVISYENVPKQSQARRFNQSVLSDRKSTRLNSSHANISYAVFCLKKKQKHNDLD